MCLLLREAMNVGRIGLSPFFFSTELQPHEARQRIKDELSSYCVINEAPKTSFGKFRKVQSPLPPWTSGCSPWPSVCADLHGQAVRCRLLRLCRATNRLLITTHLPCAGKQDDLAIALQLAMIGCQKVRLTPSCTFAHNTLTNTCTNVHNSSSKTPSTAPSAPTTTPPPPASTIPRGRAASRSARLWRRVGCR
jgi:hypothetical protein